MILSETLLTSDEPYLEAERMENQESINIHFLLIFSKEKFRTSAL